MAKAPAVNTPLWWLGKLEAELDARRPGMELMDAYYSGDHPLPFLTKGHESKMRNEFRQLLEDSRTNFMGLIVDAVDERLKVDGFRLSAHKDALSDEKSWEIWQANQMDAESQAAFLDALVKGVSYLSVWKSDDDKYPRIAVEDPMETIVGYVPGSNYRQRAAALKVWNDDWTGLRRANVYLPDAIHKYESKPDPSGNPSGSTPERRRWTEIPESTVENPHGVVPIVALRNRPRINREGRSEIGEHFRIQNQINGFLFLLALAGYFGAHKQRWAIGLTIMEDENGKPVEPFDVDVGKLWVAAANDDGGEVKFGEFQQTELSGYIKAIEQKVLHLAVVTRTPRHYLFQEGQSPSGDAIQSAESGLVKKVGRRMTPFGEGLEEAMRLARLFDGDTDAPVDSETVWRDPQTETEATITDAVIKQYEAGLIPWEAALEKLGYTQTQISRFSAMRIGDALMRDIANPTPEHPTKVVPPVVTA